MTDSPVPAMKISNDDRISPTRGKRSPLTTVVAILLATAGITAVGWYYLRTADESQVAQLAALKQTLQQQADTTDTPAPPPEATQPASDMTTIAEDTAVTSEPPLAPPPEEEPLPALDGADASIRAALAALGGWQPATTGLLAGDELLRRFVTMVHTVANGKIDHKTGPLLPIKGRFSVTTTGPVQMTADSSARYDLYANLLTALDPQQCAQLYRRYYPLLNTAWGELGEKGTFHSRVLKALQVLEATPDLATPPTLVPGLKGIYKYEDPQLEALPSAQKQLLRAGWENVSKVKVWLRQLRAALVNPPT